jgi:hypothetical protein
LLVCNRNAKSDPYKIHGWDRAAVYISDVPADDWLADVDAWEPRVTRKAVRKRPAAEGPSQKKKSAGLLGTGGPLIIDDEKSSQK